MNQSTGFKNFRNQSNRQIQDFVLRMTEISGSSILNVGFRPFDRLGWSISYHIIFHMKYEISYAQKNFI